MTLDKRKELLELARQYMSQGYSAFEAIRLAEIVLEQLERKMENERD